MPVFFLGCVMRQYSYHETGIVSADDRERYEQQAGSQEEIVLEFFRKRPGLSYSPERVQELVLPSAPLTSVRRALSNLTHAGELVKTEITTDGRYGRAVCTWTLRIVPSGQLELF